MQIACRSLEHAQRHARQNTCAGLMSMSIISIFWAVITCAGRKAGIITKGWDVDEMDCLERTSTKPGIGERNHSHCFFPTVSHILYELWEVF